VLLAGVAVLLGACWSLVLRPLAGGVLGWLWVVGSRARGALACGCQQPPLQRCCAGRRGLPKATVCSPQQVALLGQSSAVPHRPGPAESLCTLLFQLMHKLSVEAPPKILVERYLIEIAKNYNVPYEPDSVVMVSKAPASLELPSVFQ